MERCIDNSPHDFKYLRQELTEVSWHNWKMEDVYFCSKCLTYKRVEIPKKHEFRG